MVQFLWRNRILLLIIIINQVRQITSLVYVMENHIKYKGEEKMNDIILHFLEAYKYLDELCKQIFSSDVGVTKYIEEMEKETQGHFLIKDWDNDYKKLKHMRWLRNQLVHDANSFQKNIVCTDDIEWLKQFESRIINCTDSFSLLNQSRNQNNEINTVYKNTTEITNDDDKEKIQDFIFLVIMIVIVVLVLVFVNIMCF